MCGSQRGCTNLLKGDTRESRANMTEGSYQKIYCSNMMKANQDIFRDGITEQTVDIFIENSEYIISNSSSFFLSHSCERDIFGKP